MARVVIERRCLEASAAMAPLVAELTDPLVIEALITTRLQRALDTAAADIAEALRSGKPMGTGGRK